MKAEEFYQQHQEDGRLSPEAMSQMLLSGEIDFDDTGEPEREPSTPKVEAEPKEEPKAEEPKPEEKPVVLAKDGKSTIPFEELENTRKAEQEARRQLEAITAQNQELQAKLAALDTAQAEAQETGDSTEYDELLEEVKEDFPELMKAIEHRFEMQEKRHQAELDALKGSFDEQIKPFKEIADKQGQADHFDRIRTVHADLDTILAGEELGEWIKTLPKAVIDAYAGILDNGDSDDVNKMLSTFKAATGFKSTKDEAADTKGESVEDKIRKAKEKVPLSLTDVPATGSVPVDELQAMMQMSSMKLLNRFEGMTPAEIEKQISRLV